jgi:gamma-glutamyltranspeptidase/glutathione hydrolase
MARALAVAARWRQGGVTADALLKDTALPQAGLPPLPASTTWATMDRDGNAVVCTASLDNLFGTGRIVPGLGFLLAASPASVPLPLFSAALAWNDHINAFRAEVGGSGLVGAPMAVAVGMHNALVTGQAMAAPVPDPGRANVIECASYLPDQTASCRWAADPRGGGLAVGGN